MKIIHNVGTSCLTVSCGDPLFHVLHASLLRRADENKRIILENKFSR